MPGVTSVDETAAGPAQGLGGFVDERSLAAEIAEGPNAKQGEHPFAVFVKRVLAEAKITATKETLSMGSHICGDVARLPFVDHLKNDKDEFEAQVEKTARRAEGRIDSAMVWTSAAKQIARKALELRLAGKGHVDEPVKERPRG